MGIYALRFGGDLPNGKTWSVNPTYTIEDGVGGEPTNAQLLTKLGIIWTWWDTGQGGEPAGKTFFTNDLNMSFAKAQRLGIAPPPPVIDDTRVPIAGTHASPPSVPQAAFVLSLRTAVSSRRTRGRLFFPMPPDDALSDGGRFDTTYPADFRDSFVALVVALEAPVIPVLNVDHVVYSRVGSSTEEVTTYLVGNTVDTQRRRRARDSSYV